MTISREESAPTRDLRRLGRRMTASLVGAEVETSNGARGGLRTAPELPRADVATVDDGHRLPDGFMPSAFHRPKVLSFMRPDSVVAVLADGQNNDPRGTIALAPCSCIPRGGSV
jgi:hypothetical protein